MTGRIPYLVVSLLIFAVEVLIAVFVRDSWIRPFVGDVLVVVLIYTALQSLLLASPRKVALGVLALACGVEILQYFDYVALLGLQDNRWLSIILGRTFSWLDFVAYFLGYCLIRIGDPRFVEHSAEPDR